MPNFPTKALPSQNWSFSYNFLVESFFSCFNGVIMGLILFASPIVALVGLKASALELTILACSFPVGAFLGPLWADFGQRWGMKSLVIGTSLAASFFLILVAWVNHSESFTLFLAISQILNSAMRMGQTSLYRLTYPPEKRGRVVGRLTLFTYATMVPSILLAGWLLNEYPTSYRLIYPVGGICGIVGCFFYSLIRVPAASDRMEEAAGFAKRFRHIHRILRHDRLYRFFQMAFFLSGASFFMSRHVVLMLAESRFGFDAFQLSLIFVVFPQILLALGSPIWGSILDRAGIMQSRLLISFLLTGTLACYFTGFVLINPYFIYVGCFLQGLSVAGGQLTWFLASTTFAPRSEDVPSYNGVHFVLNGVRGLIMPWVGSLIFLFSGAGAILVAAFISFMSVPVLIRGMASEDERLHRREPYERSEPQESMEEEEPVPPLERKEPIPLPSKVT